MTFAKSNLGSWLRRERPVLLVWLLLLLSTAVPYLVAALAPPQGLAFTGFFFYGDDQFNYLSHSQQAEDGAFLFRNKLVLEPHEPGLVNVEWWLVGRLSALLGGSPVLANRLITVPLLLLFLLTADRWLRRLGLAMEHRFAALILLSFGGGPAWVLHSVFGHVIGQSPDLSTGLYLFQLSLTNSHFLFGLTLLLSALLLADDPRPSRQWAAILLASVLGLSRPYDMVTFGAIRTITVLAAEPVRLWPSRLVSLLGLVPVALVNYWMFFQGASHAFYTSIRYVYPSLLQYLIALLPAILLLVAALGLGWRPRERGTLLVATILWLAFVGCLVILRPVEFWAQFTVGGSVPLLILTAVALARLGARPLLAAGLVLAGNSAFLLWTVLQPIPTSFAPAEHVAAARAFRDLCRPGDIALTPPTIGHWVAAYSACTPYISHAAAPANAARVEAVNSFYGQAPPGSRAEILDALRITHVLLPGSEAPIPSRWLGAAPFGLRLTVGTGPRALSIYSREPATPQDASAEDPS